jgi:phage terminase large subunit
MEGRIYTDWQIIDDVPHEARLERHGLDFGYSNDPAAIVDVYHYNGGIILDERMYQTGVSNRRIADFIKNLNQALTIADSAEPKSIDEIKEYGVMILPANKGQGSVNQGINYLQDQKVSITKSSVNLIKEYRNYLWKTDKDGNIMTVPEKGNDHLLDATRYAVESLRPKQEYKVTTHYKPLDLMVG